MGKRGPKPKTMAEHLASGAISKNPKRFAGRMHELRVGQPLANPPADFLRDTPECRKQREIWNEIVASAGERLAESDRFIVEQTVRAIYQSRLSGAKPATIRTAADLLKALNLTPGTRPPYRGPAVPDGSAGPPGGGAEFAEFTG